MDSILETNKDFNILFIQKPPWLFIHTILSFSNEDGNSIVGTSNHPNWTTSQDLQITMTNIHESFHTLTHVFPTCVFL